MVNNTSFKIPDSFIYNLDLLVLSGYFSSRGEAIRIAIEDYISENFSFIFSENNKMKVKGNYQNEKKFESIG